MSYDFPAHESTRKRRRWGCTCGCVMILILLILFGIGFSYFGFKLNAETPRYALMDGETDGFGVLRINPEDEGSQAFISFILNRLKQAEKADPESAGQDKLIGALTKFSKNVLSQFVQPETMIYATYNPVTADENILLSTPLKNRFAWLSLRWFINENVAPKPISRNGVTEIYSLTKSDNGTSTLLSLNSDELMISDNQPLLEKSLEYAKTPARNSPPTADLQYFIDELSLDQPPVGEDLSVAMLNEESRITNMIFVFEDFVGVSGISERIAAALSAQKLTFAEITGMKLTADLASADTITGNLTLYCANSDTAARMATVFTSALTQLTSEGAGGAFKFTGKATSRGSTVVISLNISGIKAWIEAKIPVRAEPAKDAEAAEPDTLPEETPDDTQ